jgi:glycosyltransferase involved in cell wall biosynthesis
VNSPSKTLNNQTPNLGIDMDWPRVSIITPSLNQGVFLEQTIQSVIQQNYPNLEYIVIDGGSTDQSLDIIRKYEPWLAYWISEKDAGQSDAINKGFKRATGDYLAWLNSDDFYLPGCLLKLVSAFLSHPEAGMIVGQVAVINETGARIGLFEPIPRFNYIDLLTMKTILPQQAALFSRASYERVGPIRNDLHYAMDVDYFIRIGSHFPIIPLTEILACFRLSDTNKGNANRTRWPAEFIKIANDIFDQHGLDPSICYMSSQALGGAYYRGAATYLECLELGTARKWF